MLASPQHDESIGTLIAQLKNDGRDFVEAEVALQKAGLQLRLARAQTGLILAVVAIVALHLALIAGAVELAVALATLVGPLASGLIVLVGGALLAYLLVRLAIARIKPAFAPLPEGATA